MVNSIDSEQTREFLFEEKNGMYVFKLGIVLKEKGVFLIGPGNAANVYREKDNALKLVLI